MSTKIKVDEKRIEVQPETLEIHLTPELVERMDDVVELLDLDSKEDLVRCAIRRYVDRYVIIA
jgi:metal-responsive CopG/Arc/MetJ family transcriptional regulator